MASSDGRVYGVACLKTSIWNFLQIFHFCGETFFLFDSTCVFRLMSKSSTLTGHVYSLYCVRRHSDAVIMKSEIEGCLLKRSKLGFSSNTRWVEFDGETLRYANTRGNASKLEIKVLKATECVETRFSIHSTWKSFVVEGISEQDVPVRILFECNTLLERDKWISTLNFTRSNSTESTPCSSILSNDSFTTIKSPRSNASSRSDYLW